MSKSSPVALLARSNKLTFADYVVAVIAIFTIFLTGLWFGKRKDYSGPQFDVIMGTNLPETETTTIEEKDHEPEQGSEPIRKETISSTANGEGYSRHVSAST
jgi:hypothetical protein